LDGPVIAFRSAPSIYAVLNARTEDDYEVTCATFSYCLL